MKNLTLTEIAAMVGGTLVGNGNTVIKGVAPTQNAEPNELTFLEKADRAPLLKKCRAGGVIVPLGFVVDGFSVVQVADVLATFQRIVNWFTPPRSETIHGISEQAFVHPTATLGKEVSIGHFAVIEEDVELGDRVSVHPGAQIRTGSRIGEATTIFPNAVLYRNTVIGKRCIVHSGVVIGAYGFGYDSSQGGHQLSPQLGNVVIGDDVEIGSCSTIDRATYGSTIIGDGTKIDNLVMIGHNCKFGKHNLICAHTGVAGSTTTGDYVVMAGAVGVRDHVHIGHRAVLGARSGIMTDIADDAKVVGAPALPNKEFMRLQVAIHRLPELMKEFKALKKTVDALVDAQGEAVSDEQPVGSVRETAING